VTEVREMAGERMGGAAVVEVDREHIVHRLCLDRHQCDPALAENRDLGGEAGAAADQHDRINRGVADARSTLAVLGEQ
jgi:hypothetical protein